MHSPWRTETIFTLDIIREAFIRFLMIHAMILLVITVLNRFVAKARKGHRRDTSLPKER